MNTTELKNLDHNNILQTYQRYPIALTHGKGAQVWDAEGKVYLDFLAGIAVLPLGHCHPAVVAAITQQANTLMHVSNLYYTEPCVQLANLLISNGGLDKIFFCNSGAEANETSIKLARKYQWRKNKTEQTEIVSFSQSFHGRTLAALTATAKPEIQQGFAPLPNNFKYAEYNKIDNLKNIITKNTAAVIIEPVQGEGGIYVATQEFLQAVRKCCDEVGALLIFDEIQCGIGRLGTFFAYQSFAVKPDVITLAKGIANGLPLGAVCVTNDAATGLQFGDHGSTFGGNLVVAAAAIATLNIILKQNYLSQIKNLGEYLLAQLKLLQQKYPQAIAAVRGKGLMLGVEFKIDAKQVLTQCHAQGLLANVTANCVMRLLPPYIITKNEIDQAIKIIDNAIVATVGAPHVAPVH